MKFIAGPKDGMIIYINIVRTKFIVLVLCAAHAIKNVQIKDAQTQLTNKLWSLMKMTNYCKQCYFYDENDQKCHCNFAEDCPLEYDEE